jgi:hypothetical protein
MVRTPVQVARTGRTRRRGGESDTVGWTWRGRRGGETGHPVLRLRDFIPPSIGRPGRRLWGFEDAGELDGNLHGFRAKSLLSPEVRRSRGRDSGDQRGRHPGAHGGCSGATPFCIPNHPNRGHPALIMSRDRLRQVSLTVLPLDRWLREQPLDSTTPCACGRWTSTSEPGRTSVKRISASDPGMIARAGRQANFAAPIGRLEWGLGPPCLSPTPLPEAPRRGLRGGQIRRLDRPAPTAAGDWL